MIDAVVTWSPDAFRSLSVRLALVRDLVPRLVEVPPKDCFRFGIGPGTTDLGCTARSEMRVFKPGSSTSERRARTRLGSTQEGPTEGLWGRGELAASG